MYEDELYVFAESGEYQGLATVTLPGVQEPNVEIDITSIHDMAKLAQSDLLRQVEYCLWKDVNTAKNTKDIEQLAKTANSLVEWESNWNRF